MLSIHMIYNASVYLNTHARVQNNAMKASVYVCVYVCVQIRGAQEHVTQRSLLRRKTWCAQYAA